MADGKHLLVSLVVRARDEASGKLGGMQRKLAGIAAAITGYFSGRAIVQFFRGAIGGARGLQEQMSVLRAVTGASIEDMARLEKAASQMGATTRFTSLEAAQALESLSRAGLSVDESLSALPEVLALAQGNAIGLEAAAGLVTGAVRGMGLEFSEAARVADVLTSAAARSKTTVDDLGVGLSFVAPVASQAGLSLERTVAVLGRLADNNIKASRGGTSLANVLAQLEDPTGRFRRELGKLGITSTEFVDVLAGLEAAGPKASAAINSVGLEAGPALRALIGAGAESVREFDRELQSVQGAARNAAAVMDDNLNGALRGLGSIWASIRTELAKPLLDPIADQVRALTDRLREAQQSGLISALGRTLKESFDTAVAAITDFVGNLDFGAAARGAIGWVEAISRNIDGLARTFSGVSGAIQVVWHAVYQSVALVGAGIAKILQGVTWSIERVAAGLARLGVVSAETARELDIAQGALGASAEAMADASIASYERMIEAARQVGHALSGTRAEADELKITAQDLAAAMEHVAAVDREGWLAAERHAEAISSQEEALAAQRAALEEQRAALESLRDTYNRTLDAWRAGDATWDQVLEKFYEVQEAQRALTEDLAAGAGDVAAAFATLGIESTETLTNLAREARTAYETIAAGDTTIHDQRRAWLAWAEAAIGSGDAVQLAMAQAEAGALGLAAEFRELAAEAETTAAANVELESSLQRLVDGYADAERAATREAVALAESTRMREEAARTALDAAKARGDENEIREASIALANAEVATAEAIAAAKAAESFAAWEHVRALTAEAQADGVLTAAEARVIQAAREVAQVKEEQARAHAGAADAKREEAQATQTQVAESVGWAELVEHVRGQYREMSDEAEAYFNRMFSTVRTLRQFFEILGSKILNETRAQFERMTVDAADLQAELARGEATTVDLARAQRFLNDQWRRGRQVSLAMGQEQLEPLRRALADAQRRMEALESSAQDTLGSLTEELLGLQGQEDELAERRLARRRAEIQAQIAEARAARNDQAVRDFQAALKVLEQIGREEASQRQAREREDRELDATQSADAQPRGRTGQAPTPLPRTVRMEISIGGRQGAVDVLEGSESELERLLRELEAGSRTVQ